MADKRPLSSFPSHRQSPSSSFRRPRRRLLPLILLVVLGLIYLSRNNSRIDHVTASIVPDSKSLTQHQDLSDMKLQNEAEQDTPEIKTYEEVTEHKQSEHEKAGSNKKQSACAESSTEAVAESTAVDAIATPTHAVVEASSTDAAASSGPSSLKDTSQAHHTTNVTKVSLDAHVMSKCPDAKGCLEEMVVPAMEQISDLVNFNLSIVGNIEPDGSITCKHGPTECLGDTLILCAQSLYANSTVRSLGFANCLIGNYRQIPERAHVQNCALEHGVDFEALNDCASDSEKGEKLLEDAVRWTRDVGVKYSCTVRLEGKQWCVMDGGEWKDCESGSEVKDLVSKVKELAGKGKKDGTAEIMAGHVFGDVAKAVAAAESLDEDTEVAVPVRKVIGEW